MTIPDAVLLRKRDPFGERQDSGLTFARLLLRILLLSSQHEHAVLALPSASATCMSPQMLRRCLDTITRLPVPQWQRANGVAHVR